MNDQNEIKNSVVRTIVSLIQIPGVGQALTEMIEYRSKVKQNRLNQFTELLENYFTNHAGINLENFQTEEFGDLFESVIRRIVLTHSAEKMKMYRDILINHLENPTHPIDESEIYLDLIAELTELEIRILFEYRELARSLQSEINQLTILEGRLSSQQNRNADSPKLYNSDIVDIEKQIGRKRKKINSLQNVRKADYFSISNDQYLFYKQRLFSKGLLVDSGIGSIGGKPFATMNITQFGIQFTDYIMASS